MPKIAILMTCHNRIVTTLRCLRSVASCTREASIVLYLVDDGSTDGTSEQVKTWHREGGGGIGLRIIPGTGNLYWAKGMALAWRTSLAEDYDFFLWLNDDVVLYPNAFRILLDDYDKTEGVVVGACCAAGGGLISYGASDALDRKIVPIGVPQKAAGWFSGNVVLVPYDVYAKVGIISDEYTHARADYDYAERLRKAGVSFYSSSRFVGECQSQFKTKMRDKTVFQRISLLWKPGYWNLHDLWLIRSRYHGKIRALVSCCHLIGIAVRYKSK